MREERPTLEQTTRRRLIQTQSKYKLRIISPEVFFSEEQRPSIHVKGSSRQGKSHFLEWLMREDIDRGIGCCLLDPTSGGQTAYKMLSYCAEKGRDKVLFIDPSHHYPPYKKVVGLQPFMYAKDGRPMPKLRAYSVENIKGTVRALFSVKDAASQPFVERYLPAILKALYDAKRPLRDARFFSNKKHKPTQDAILDKTDPDTQFDLEEAFRDHRAYQNIQSSISRLMRFYRGILGSMFSPSKGVDWMKVIREHWAVIVNLETGAGFDELDARLLGTYILNELITAKLRLNRIIDSQQDVANWGKFPPYYIYADEAFMFASNMLQHFLDMRQKTNLKLTLAHHYDKQFEDPAVYQAIVANCDMTAMFYTKGKADRQRMAEEFYGGDIDPEDAAFNNANLPKQTAVIKIGKDSPIRTRIPTVPPPKVGQRELQEYISNIYRGEWYYDAPKLDTYDESTGSKGADSKSSDPGAKTKRKPGSKAGVSNDPDPFDKWKDVS